MKNIVKISDWIFTNQSQSLCSSSNSSSSSSGDISWDAGEAGFKPCVIFASDK